MSTTEQAPNFPYRLGIALAVYLISLFAANTLGLKTMPFLWGTHLSVAVFWFPIVFLMTDVVGEIYGKRIARMFVHAGVLSIALFLLFSFIAQITPWSPHSLWAKPAYEKIFSLSMRFSIASLVAYAIGEYQDIFAFFKAKAKIGSKYFWLRSNLSNLWSQLFDTFVFLLIAFWGVYSFKAIVLMAIPWYLYKVIVGVCYTPLSYIGLKLLKPLESREV